MKRCRFCQLKCAHCGKMSLGEEGCDIDHLRVEDDDGREGAVKVEEGVRGCGARRW